MGTDQKVPFVPSLAVPRASRSGQGSRTVGGGARAGRERWGGWGRDGSVAAAAPRCTCGLHGAVWPEHQGTDDGVVSVLVGASLPDD